MEVTRTRWKQREAFSSFDERMSWGALALRFRLFKPTKTIEVGLSTDTLFSSLRSDRLLIYHSDIIRHTADAFLPMTPEAAAKATVCAIRDMINDARDRTAVYVVLAPDKRSIYAPWITTPLPEKAVGFLDVLKGQLGGRYIDLFGPLSAAVHAGQKDLYFPNDTHWSASGHQLVGNTIADAIGGKKPAETSFFVN